MNRYLILIALSLQLVACTADEHCWSTVFGLTGEQLEPMRTKELLKRLREFYHEENDQIGMERKIQLKVLLEASRISESKCRSDPLKEFDSLLASFAQYKLNIIPFLEYYKNKQIALCDWFKNENIQFDDDNTHDVQELQTHHQYEHEEDHNHITNDEIQNRSEYEEQQREENPVPADWIELADEVFAPDAHAMNKDHVDWKKVEQMLEKIQETQINVYHTNERHQQKEAENLLAVCDYSNSDAVIRRFDKLNLMIEQYATHKRNIQPYLVQCRKRCLDSWRKHFETKAAEDMANMRFDMKNALVDLGEKVFAISHIKEPYFDVPINEIKQGYLDFVQSQKPSLLARIGQLDKDKFEEKLAQSFKVGHYFCVLVQLKTPHMRPKSAYIRLLSRNQELIQEVDKKTLEWVGRLKICDQIIDNWYSVSEFVYESLASKKN